MRYRSIGILAVVAMIGVAPAALASGKMTTCKMTYSLQGWSVFYSVAHGSGTIRCDNGQRAKVKIVAKGGGITAGRTKIRDGRGKFSEAESIDDLFGTYVEASAQAGAGKSAGARAMTKGEISLALTGKGSGVQVGIAFGKFTITRVK